MTWVPRFNIILWYTVLSVAQSKSIFDVRFTLNRLIIFQLNPSFDLKNGISDIFRRRIVSSFKNQITVNRTANLHIDYAFGSDIRTCISLMIRVTSVVTFGKLTNLNVTY